MAKYDIVRKNCYLENLIFFPVVKTNGIIWLPEWRCHCCEKPMVWSDYLNEDVIVVKTNSFIWLPEWRCHCFLSVDIHQDGFVYGVAM